MANTVTWNKHDYVQQMRRRIDKPTCWKDILDVQYSNNRTIVNSSLTTEPSVVAGTRGTAYNYEDFILTADTLTINQFYNTPIFIDEADRHQQSYVDQMKIADFQGKKINEKLESLMLAAHATNHTDYGAGDLAGTSTDDTTQITISATNIDDLWRDIRRKIWANNGVDFAVENGIFAVWTATEMSLLEGFAQANGYSEADMALKSGIPVQKGFYYGGVSHYLTTLQTANHRFAGIKKMGKLGILAATNGVAKFIEDPAKVSGLGIVSRNDHGFNWTSYYIQFNIDVNTST